MKTLAEISIQRPVFAWILMAGLMFFGGIAFSKMGISHMPDVDFPVVNIKLQMEGASPEIMETNVVDIVEESLLSTEGIKEITSKSLYGSADITVELELERNVDVAVQEISTRISQAQKYLPETLAPPVISK